MRSSLLTGGDETAMSFIAAVFKLFKFHIFDWLAILGLVILTVGLKMIEPFHHFVGKTTISDYIYPLKPNTVPSAALPVIALAIPMLIFVCIFLYKRDVTDLHHAILGLLFALAITTLITQAVKDMVGRPRPDFFWRCFPDGVAVFKNSTGEVECSGDPEIIKEGYKSFPSGHTSWAFSGLGFLSIYLAGKLNLFDQKGHVSKLVLVFTPLIGALLVGLSRVDDYWHHWQDVFAGAILGLTMAVLCYHHFFPSLFRADCMMPHRYLPIGQTGRIGIRILR